MPPLTTGRDWRTFSTATIQPVRCGRTRLIALPETRRCWNDWFVSRIHRKKPKGKTMPERTRIANAQKSKVRSAIEHVFAHQMGLLHLTIRTIGLARARVKIGLANLAYNI